jgi:hypothetical protein
MFIDGGVVFSTAMKRIVSRKKLPAFRNQALTSAKGDP